MTIAQGESLFQFFPRLEVFWTPTQTFWNLFNSANRSAITLRRDNSSFYLEGDPKHYYCILQWLESLLCIFKASVCQVRGQTIMKYFEFNPSTTSSFEPPPFLMDRYISLFKQRNQFTKPKTVQKAKPAPLEPLDPQEKKVILEYAQQIISSYDSEEEDLFQLLEEEEEEEEEEDTSSEELGDVSIFAPSETVLRSDFLLRKGYSLLHSSSFTDSLHEWLSTPKNQTKLLCNIFETQGGIHLLSLSLGAQKMLDTNSAGCGHACQLSEATSFDLFHSLIPQLSLSQSEMEIDYWKTNSPKLDYLCKYGNKKIGVSVTRAWNGPNRSYSRSHARRLLEKKLTGLDNARHFVSSDSFWEQQILHIWTPSESVSVLLMRELDQMEELVSTISIPTLIVFSSTNFQIPTEASFLFRCS